MSKFVHLLGQLGIGVLGAIAQYGGLVQGKYKPLALALQVLAHAILALVNHGQTGQ